jgi:hypothetical protein
MTACPMWTRVAKRDHRAAVLGERVRSCPALAGFRLTDNTFLFAYKDLAIYSDQLGDPIPSRYDDTIEWYGRPRSVTFVRPHVFAFDANYVEVWNVDTGRLVQIIKGEDMICTFDGTDVDDDGAGRTEGRRGPHVAYRGPDGHYLVAELTPVEGEADADRDGAGAAG